MLEAELWTVMVSLWKTSLWILKSQGLSNKPLTTQVNIFQELVWITIIIMETKTKVKLKNLKVKNKTTKWNIAKILDLKIKTFYNIWIIEFNNQRI